MIYENSYKNDDENEKYLFNFNEIRNQQHYSYTEDYYFADINGEFIINEKQDSNFYHSYVGVKESNYADCDSVKNDALQYFADKVDEIKKKIEINDGSTEYIINIFLITLFLIIFI